MVIERRLFVRFQIAGTVLIQMDPAKPQTIDTELIDLSYEGAGIYSPVPLAPETKVKFLLINRQLNVNIGGCGRIVFCKPVQYNDKQVFRVGVEFIEVDHQVVKVILLKVREIREGRPAK